MKIVAGIDVGSTYTKAAVLDAEARLLGRGQTPTGYRLEEAARAALGEALVEAGLPVDRAPSYVVSTGYGRFQVAFRDTQVTELTAHARGAHHIFPATRTLLDIGGQTMKAVRMDARGKVVSFRLNDKCAAGTGAFLEKTARYLGFGAEELGPLAATSRSPVPISGVCAVFAESEVINHVSSGAAPADIVYGAIQSLVDRSVQLLRRVKIEPDCTLVGGILRIEAMVRLLEEKLAVPVRVPPGDLVQYTGAIGAAVLALRRLAKAQPGMAAKPAAVRVPAPAPAPRRPRWVVLNGGPEEP
jgi:predicted CoA-substrate-specific enzyme activase